MTVSDVLAATATPYTPPSEISGVKKQVQGAAYQVRATAEPCFHHGWALDG